jgi:Asp-tRNA(Asn)/Glu-tRNA(Gln) amidotransferase A subunit family amidase
LVDEDETNGLWWSSARELARQLSERRVSSVEVLKAHLERIEQHNGH